MKEAELKFRLETGQNAKETKMVSERPGETQEVQCYTDDYIEWLESKAEINTKSIEILAEFVRLADEFGLYLSYFKGTYIAANKLLKTLKLISK